MTGVTAKTGDARPAVLLAALFVVPLLLALPEPLNIGSAKAASDCNYDSSTAAKWHKQVNSFNMSGVSNNYYGDDEYYYEEDWGDERPWWGPTLEGDNIYNKSELKALRSDFHSSFLVSNDSSSGLRMNLTYGYRYTFCFVVHSDNQSTHLPAPLVDFYLLQEYDWDFYRRDFEIRAMEDRDLLNLIPPEWRDIVAWMPYRDVHSYEGKRQLDFTVSLDADETSGAFFGLAEPETEWMYIVIDGWDNMRDSDTPAPHRNFTVDLTIMTEERLTLPKFTVSLFCCGLFLSLLAAPVVLHSKFVNAGKADGGGEGVDLMPLMETDQTRPNATLAPEKPPPPPP
jgi:hypothetical protein